MTASLPTAEQRRRAARRAGIVREVEELNETMGKTAALAATAARHGVSAGSIRRWMDARTDAPIDHLDRGGRGRPMTIWAAPGAEDAYGLWRADYLRDSKPTAEECLRRTLDIAVARGWAPPRTAKAYIRRLRKETPQEVVVRAREGAGPLLDLHPAQERSVEGLAPLDVVSGDGHPYNLMVILPSGRVGRPVIWHWQDVRTRRLLTWQPGETESADLVRLSFHELVTTYGAPGHVVVDSTRAAANRWFAGRQPGRRRGRIQESEVAGILYDLQIRFTATAIDRDSAGKGKGRARSKPVERAFNDFAAIVERHPLAAEAYTGRSVEDRPETHRQRPIEWRTFLALVEEGVAEYNTRTGRRTEAAAGRSFDEVWRAEIGGAVVRRLTAAQAALLLLPVESTAIRADGTFRLRAGRAAGVPANRYHHPRLLDHRYRGRRLAVRFDPDDLHGPVHVLDPEGAYLCLAECVLPVGFADTAAARANERERRRFRRATEEQLRALDRMDELRDALDETPRPAAPPDPEPVAVRLVAGAAASRSAPSAPDIDPGRRATFLRGLKRRAPSP